jgi:hypothetical protein
MSYELKDGVYKYIIPKITAREKQENRLRLAFIKHFRNYALDFTRYGKVKSNVYLYGHSMSFVNQQTELCFIAFSCGYFKGLRK